MTFIRENLLWILIAVWLALVFFTAIRDGYSAWKNPELLKKRSVASAEKWPKWHPYRKYYIYFYNTDNYVYLVRILSIFLPTTWVILILSIFAAVF